jgi:peptidyl-prolyl cis-trans isomerase C
MTSLQRNLSMALLSALLVAVVLPVPGRGEEAKPAGKEATPRKKSSPSDPVARVGKQTITRGELDRAVATLSAQKRVPEGTFEVRKRTERLVLDQLIAAELLYQEGMKNPPKNLDRRVKDKLAENRARFKTTIKESKLSDRELVEVTRKNIVINDYVEKKLAATIKVSDDEVKRFFEVNRDKLDKGVQLRASHILSGVPAKASAKEKQKARDKATALLKRVRGGEDFARLARENSSCPSKTQGGDLGYFGKDDMAPPFEKAAFALKPGEVSGVVESEYGFHIIKLTDRKEAKPLRLDDVRDKIREFIRSEKKQGAITAQLDKLKGHGRVEMLQGN